ncbi:MAG: immune inhibitor A [Candidatus Zixiibacteriota bacterium]|nr:MAG: immune inhibitor A [candidate division Zixibacteria bacterium]
MIAKDVIPVSVGFDFDRETEDLIIPVGAMPPNRGKISSALVARGVIPAGMPEEQAEEIIDDYIRLKLADAGRQGNRLALGRIEDNEKALDALPTGLRGRKLGQSVNADPSSPQFKPLAGSDKLLVLLVDFSNTPYTWTPTGGQPRTAAGPLHNQIPRPDNDFDLWVPNFDAQHYQAMLFAPGGWSLPGDDPYYPGAARGSLHDYYLEQSYGRYTVDGDVYGWFTVPRPEAYYGDDDPAGGLDRLGPGTPATLVQHAVSVINAASAVNWTAYDVADPWDLDGDGDYDEPDCIVDHPVFVHAGADQSAGGGAQGDDALWSYSTHLGALGKVSNVGTCDWLGSAGTYIYNYTVMPEDGGVGIFAHEFAHDIGLEDEYDTAYSSGAYGDSPGSWSLMASGAWGGRPGQTQPSDLSVYGRMLLGWVSPSDGSLIDVDFASLDEPVTLRLEQVERWGGPGTANAVRILLPDQIVEINEPYRGKTEWFGGQANLLDNTLRREVDLTGVATATLSFATWYDIEAGWDFSFVQVSTDGGASWSSLPIDGTTTEHEPGALATIVAQLPGFTGSSGGWVEKSFDLSAYAGQTILLQFRCMTDPYTANAGFFIDDIEVRGTPHGPVFSDGAETPDPGWSADGWTRTDGTEKKAHYYLAEWRNLNAMQTPYGGTSIVNFDAGLQQVPVYDQYGPTPTQPFYFPYASGLLLWYRDTNYTDNWTGDHPGHGMLLVVDAHDRPLVHRPRPSYWMSAVCIALIQSCDATFSLERAPDITLLEYGVAQTYNGGNAMPGFDDRRTYWNPSIPFASVITPTYGLVFRIMAQAEDGSAVVLGIGR